jgi:hypothetical protein
MRFPCFPKNKPGNPLDRFPDFHGGKSVGCPDCSGRGPMEGSSSKMKSASFAKFSPHENTCLYAKVAMTSPPGNNISADKALNSTNSWTRTAAFGVASYSNLSMNVAGDHHSIHATNLTRNVNLNPPKKWTETPWFEGTQSAARPRVTLAGLSTSEWNTLWTWDLRYQVTGLRQDSGAGALAAARHPNAYVRTTCELSIRLFNACCVSAAPVDCSGFLGCSEPAIAAKTGSSGPFEAGWRLEKIAPWHPICSKSILLPIDARTGLRTLRAGVSPACKRGMATIGQWCHGQSWSAKRCEVLRK